MTTMRLRLSLEESGKKKDDIDEDDLNPNQALGDNTVLTLADQDIEKITNKGGVATILTPAGILTTDSKERGW